MNIFYNFIILITVVAIAHVIVVLYKDHVVKRPVSIGTFMATVFWVVLAIGLWFYYLMYYWLF